jgi:hypothetical protein
MAKVIESYPQLSCKFSFDSRFRSTILHEADSPRLVFLARCSRRANALPRSMVGNARIRTSDITIRTSISVCSREEWSWADSTVRWLGWDSGWLDNWRIFVSPFKEVWQFDAVADMNDAEAGPRSDAEALEIGVKKFDAMVSGIDTIDQVRTQA